MSTIAAVFGRILLALIFVVSGTQKIIDPSSTAAMLGSMGLPTNLALPTGVFELVAGVLLAIGLMSRLVAALLFLFVALTTMLFHNQVTDPMQATQALKNLAIMGGLLMVLAYGQMRWSYDHWRERDRLRKAELRAARAEGRADGATETHRAAVTEH
jgi:putative oxidoreductase